MTSIRKLSNFFKKGERVYLAHEKLPVHPFHIMIDEGFHIEFFTIEKFDEEDEEINTLSVFIDEEVSLFKMLYYVSEMHEVSLEDVCFMIVEEDYWREFDGFSCAEDFFCTYSDECKEELLEFEPDIAELALNISFSKGLASYCFRQGPIEELHTQGKISQEEMEQLNRFMTNRLSFAFEMIQNNQSEDLLKFLEFHLLMTNKWDLPDTTEPEEEYNRFIKN